VTITPETKDWTWVLDGPCPECGLDTREVELLDIPELLRTVAAAFADVLADGEAARRRPSPAVWSPLEYACHLRDVCRRFDARLRLLLVLDDPVFQNWDQDAAAISDGYSGQDPALVSLELTEAAERLATAIEHIPEGAWDRPGRRSDGAQFTVVTLVRYLAHELVHHAHDVLGDLGADAGHPEPA
jgi:DinB superfamily